MRCSLFIYIIPILYCCSDLAGQIRNKSTLKTKYLFFNDCKAGIDSNTLVPNTVILTYNTDTLSKYKIYNNNIILSDSECNKYKDKMLKISYRTFAFDLEKPYFVMDTSLLEFKEKALISGYEFRPNSNKNALIESRGLDYKGSFARGLSVGNSQSLVLNSNFDMQLIGDLGNGLKVVAAISDENLPIQAQGNTQQLQEFDKVFIQVSKDRTSVTAGDYELRRPSGYFMNYFKKVKGITLNTNITLNKSTEITAKGSFAISRGKFARQPLATKEGNQGPYRLTGNNNERFIIVLAGTEKVYFNGTLLVRGFDYDYVIDYNRAEITFSPTRVIARDSRVIMEFEYTDINYLRSLYAANTEYKGQKWNVNVNFYSEQDSKTSTGDIQLDSTDIKILEESGDDPKRATRKSIRLITGDDKKETNRILYKGRLDPTDPSNTILNFTESIDSAQYVAVFTEVGQGQGDYVIDNTKNKNARVYAYAGKNMGSYLPVIQLIPPEQKQLFTTNGYYKFSKNGDVYAELGLSNFDKNRRSPIDNNDNVGWSSYIAVNQFVKLDTSGNWVVKGTFKNEHLSRNFTALNQYRVPEFTRDWNISQLTQKGEENLLNSYISLEGKSGLSADYGINSFIKSGVYNGLRQEGSVKYKGEKVSFRAFSNFLTSTAAPLDQKSTFIRPNISALYKIDKNNFWGVGSEFDAEINEIRSIAADTLAKKSYRFQNLKLFITSDFSRDFALKFAYSVRNDFFAKQNNLKQAASAREIEFSGKWLASKNSDLQWNIIARDLEIKDGSLLPNDKSKKTILGRLDYTFSSLHQGIRSVTSYNTSSGQEPKLEYIFQKVEVGQGDYFLINESPNPNLSNIQDFRYDPTNPLSRYIRLTLTNNEFVRTNNIELNQNLTIEPSKFKIRKEGDKINSLNNFFSKFSTLSNFRISKKQMDNRDSPLTSYLNFGLQDTSLVAYNALNTNTIFFNRGNVKYDLQIGNRNNQNRIVQISGKEDRGLNEYFFRSRWNIQNKADFFFILEKSNKSYQSVSFGTRNLDIDIYRIKPEISFRPTLNTRLNIKYNYQHKNQNILTKDLAFIHEFTSEFAVRKANTYSLDLILSFVKINFTGKANSPIEYDMLEGLKNGKNYLWNVVYTKRLAKNIDLTINYEGRKTGESQVVNVGRAQVKATF